MVYDRFPRRERGARPERKRGVPGRRPCGFPLRRRQKSSYASCGAKRWISSRAHCRCRPWRLAAWREAFLSSGQEAMQNQPGDVRDREIARLREKLGESTMEHELLREKI